MVVSLVQSKLVAALTPWIDQHTRETCAKDVSGPADLVCRLT